MISFGRASIVLSVIPILAALMSANWVPGHASTNRLDHSKVGVYGTLLDFCDYSVYKIIFTDPQKHRASLVHWAKRLKETRQQGKLNLVGLYCFDRIQHSRPIPEYLANADAMLQAIDLRDVYAVFLSEENVTWNNGLAVLNALYDHVKARYPVQVYQWLTNPDVPHPKLKADGWIIDPYGFDRIRFRKYLMKYLVTGKPVIDCITASPDPGAPWDITAKEQVEVCREFNVPMFFYCVDNRWGSPDVWWLSDDPEIVAPREWLLDLTSRLRHLDVRTLPLLSAEYSPGKAIEVAGDSDCVVRFTEEFADTGFIDDACIRGFNNLRWDGQEEALYFRPGSQKSDIAELIYHFISDFEMYSLTAEAEGETVGVPVSIALSATGHNWPHSTTIRRESGTSKRPFQLRRSAVGDAAFRGKEFWLRFRADVSDASVRNRVARVDVLRLTAVMSAPERKEVALVPTTEGCVRYADGFRSPKYLHVAEIVNARELNWSPGRVSTQGVAGFPNLVSMKWKFVCEKPLQDIVVHATCRGNEKNLGSVNRLAVSLDGQNRLVEETTSGKPTNSQGTFQGTLQLDLSGDPRFACVKQFWVHFDMENFSGVKTNESNTLERLELSARIRAE